MSIQVDRRKRTVVVDGLRFDISLIEDPEYIAWRTRYDEMNVAFVRIGEEYKKTLETTRNMYQHFKDIDPEIVSCEERDGRVRYGYTVLGGLCDTVYASGCAEKHYEHRDKWTYRIYMRKCDALVEMMERWSKHSENMKAFLRDSPSDYRITRKLEEIVRKYCDGDSF